MKKKTNNKNLDSESSYVYDEFPDSEEILLREEEYEKYLIRIRDMSRGI